MKISDNADVSIDLTGITAKVRVVAEAPPAKGYGEWENAKVIIARTIIGPEKPIPGTVELRFSRGDLEKIASEISHALRGAVVVDIVVNGVTHPLAVTDCCVSYEQVVDLANKPHGATVVYSHGADGTEGSLIPGRWARVQDGTVFDAVMTNSA